MFLFLLTVALCEPLLWGPYRPNLYLGMRPQIPESLLTGLMWFQSSEIRSIANLRHTVKNDDTVAKFGWEAFDARVGGRQTIYDLGNKVNLTTDLVKSSDGSAWELRVTGNQSTENIITMIFYAGLEYENKLDSETPPGTQFLRLSTPHRRKLTAKGIDLDNLALHGNSPELGQFRLVVERKQGEFPTHKHPFSKEKPASNIQYSSLFVPSGEQWQANQIYMTLLQDEVSQFIDKYGDEDPDVPVWSIMCPVNKELPNSNLHFIQQTFKGNFELRFKFIPKQSEELFKSGELKSFNERFKNVLLEQQRRFNKSLVLQPPYNLDPKFYHFANEMISNVAAGVGYFYGDSLQRATGSEDDFEEVSDGVLKVKPHELLSGTPSRAFFPRGFYWDEGFNALALMEYDQDLVLRILNSWFSTMDDTGYIQREQILGPEGRSLVPEEFQVQDSSVANPPTLVMALAHLTKSGNKGDALLEQLYPKLQTHFKWFRTTQKGETTAFDREYPSKEVYRWRGRTKTHCLASGLDDYPRASEVSDADLNVDLVSWVGAMAQSLSHIATRLGKSEDAQKYDQIISEIKTNLEHVFWDEESGAYCDVGIDEYEDDSKFCHIGYVTHLPFMLKLVPEESSERLMKMLKHLRNEDELWSVGGIRSLSKQDEFFGTEEDYWRGPVWNNMNYLTLDALLHYATSPNVNEEVREFASDIYRELRLNVVENIYRHYKRTGFVWESYTALTGEPKGAKAFTGWAALVANIMAMPEVPGMDEQGEKPSEKVAEAAASASSVAAEAASAAAQAAAMGFDDEPILEFDDIVVEPQQTEPTTDAADAADAADVIEDIIHEEL